MKSAISVKDRLKNYAKKNGRVVQDVFTAYVLERTLYRVSVSPYAGNFTLKGGILLYATFLDKFMRATTDIDLLGAKISNDAAGMKEVFSEIFSIQCDDPIVFRTDTLNVMNITEFKEYHGLNVSILALLDRTRIPVNIDIGFGDVVYPERVRMDYPTLLDDEPASVFAYSLESVVAEKMEAIVSLGEANGRLKDFYDICSLAEQSDFDGIGLQKAVKETFAHRGTSFGVIEAFEDGFCEDPIRASRWRGFLRNKSVLEERNFAETVRMVKMFIEPVIDAIRRDEEWNAHWDNENQKWA